MTIAVRTPTARTRSARSPNSAASACGRPNSLTSVAPPAEKRSVICPVIEALRSADSRCSAAIRRPMRRAGRMKIGRRISARSVTCHASATMTTTARTSWIELVTRPESVEVNARCAPMTSLFSRLTSEPVRVRVKKASGIRWTWENTARRRS